MRLISLTNPPSLLESFFGEGFTPAVDVNQNENSVVVRAEIPGVDPTKVEITVHGDVLTLSGEKTGGLEWRAGKFERSVQLPCDVDVDKTVAHAEHGVLTITLDKRAEDKAKKIQVNVN